MTTAAGPLPEQGNIEASVSYFDTFQFDRASRILDVGTRFGSFLDRLRQSGYRNSTGIDVDPAVIDTGRQAYPYLAPQLVHYPGNNLPFQAGQFDVVTAFDVIEHVPSVEIFLAEIRRVLKAQGTFIFQTPNKIINIPKEIIYTRSLLRWRQYHCSLQTLASLQNALAKAGFSQVVVEKRDICTAFNIEQSRQHLGFFGPPLLRLLRKMPLQFYPNFWGHARNG